VIDGDRLSDPLEKVFERADDSKLSQALEFIKSQKRAEAEDELRRKAPQSKDCTLYEKTETIKRIWEQLVYNHYQRNVGKITDLPVQVVQKWLV
jgi:hypothetical protein